MDSHVLPTCPKCSQIDQIQKVTSVYGANTKEWYETHSRTDIDGHSESYQEFHEAHTQLGLKLQPPKQPTGPAHPGILYGIVGFVVIILGSVLCPVVLIPLGLLIPLFAASSTIPNFTDVPNWTILTAVTVGGILCVALVGLGLIVWLGFVVKRRIDRDMSAYKAKKAVYDQDDLPRWQRAKDRWEQLYYCMRDETVFIPAENKVIRVADMEKYLYDPFFRS